MNKINTNLNALSIFIMFHPTTYSLTEIWKDIQIIYYQHLRWKYNLYHVTIKQVIDSRVCIHFPDKAMWMDQSFTKRL